MNKSLFQSSSLYSVSSEGDWNAVLLSHLQVHERGWVHQPIVASVKYGYRDQNQVSRSSTDQDIEIFIFDWRPF